MTISEAGFEVTVEEIRTLCGEDLEDSILLTSTKILSYDVAIAWIPTNLFTTFEFHKSASSEPACFEISLDALLQCLNIFGNAAPSSGGNILPPMARSKRRWAGEDDDSVVGSTDDRPRGGKEKRTGMRMVWSGPGHPLSMLL